jgi:hypothetical protein
MPFLPTPKEQALALRRLKIVTIKRDGTVINKATGRAIKDWTVYRLYNTYVTKKKPLSTPLYEAYDTEKNILKRAEKNPDLVLNTPKGKMSLKKYVRKIRKNVDQQTKRRMPTTASLTLNRYLKWSEKVQDILQIPLNISANEKTYKKTMDYFMQYTEQYVKPTVEGFINSRRRLYRLGEHVIGVRCSFKTSPLLTTANRDFDNVSLGDSIEVTSFHTTVPYVSLKNRKWLDTLLYNRQDGVVVSVKRGFEKVFNYQNATVTLTRLSFVVITRTRATSLEKMRGISGKAIRS